MDGNSAPTAESDTTRSESGATELHASATLADLEQVIERIGARYVADLRALSQELSRFYDAQLAAKDEQIADLSQRLESAERERDALASRNRELVTAHLDKLKQLTSSYLGNVQSLAEELERSIKSVHQPSESVAVHH